MKPTPLLFLMLASLLISCSDSKSGDPIAQMRAQAIQRAQLARQASPPVITSPSSPLSAQSIQENPFVKAFADSTVANGNFMLIQTTILDQYKYKVIREPHCIPFVDLVLAAQRSSKEVTNEVREKRVHDALIDGYKAKCFIAKTKVDLMPVQLRDYWYSYKAKIAPTPNCQYRINQADQIVMSESTDEEKQYQLTKLVTETASDGCMRQ